MGPKFSPKVYNLVIFPSPSGCHPTLEQSRGPHSPKLAILYFTKKYLSLVQHKTDHFFWLFQHQSTPVLARILNNTCLWLASCLKKCHFLLKMKWNFVISGLYQAAFIRKWSLHLNENLLPLLVPAEPLQVNIIYIIRRDEETRHIGFLIKVMLYSLCISTSGMVQ